MGVRVLTRPRHPAPGLQGAMSAPGHRASGDGTRARGGRHPAPRGGSRRARRLPPRPRLRARPHLGHTLLSSGDQTEARQLFDRGNDVGRRVQNPRCQARAAWGRARLAFAAGRPDLEAEECRRATALLQNREFPWALAQLREFQAETATAAGRLEVANEARAAARQVTITEQLRFAPPPPGLPRGRRRR